MGFSHSELKNNLFHAEIFTREMSYVKIQGATAHPYTPFRPRPTPTPVQTPPMDTVYFALDSFVGIPWNGTVAIYHGMGQNKASRAQACRSLRHDETYFHHDIHREERADLSINIFGSVRVSGNLGITKKGRKSLKPESQACKHRIPVFDQISNYFNTKGTNRYKVF